MSHCCAHQYRYQTLVVRLIRLVFSKSVLLSCDSSTVLGLFSNQTTSVTQNREVCSDQGAHRGAPEEKAEPDRGKPGRRPSTGGAAEAQAAQCYTVSAATAAAGM